MGIFDLLGMDEKALRKLAKEFDTPEMRKLYREQKLRHKALGQSLDDEVKKLSEIVENLFKHDEEPPK